MDPGARHYDVPKERNEGQREGNEAGRWPKLHAEYKLLLSSAFSA
jgi:hypothetical protein